jgi:hypothetical protein
MNVWEKEKRKKEKKTRERERLLCQVVRAVGQIFIFVQAEKKKEKKGRITLVPSFFSVYYQVQRSSSIGDKDKRYYLPLPAFFFSNKEMKKSKKTVTELLRTRHRFFFCLSLIKLYSFTCEL